MAEFNPAYERMIVDEGGYKLTDKPHDRGGQTYAGISRKMNPQWEGWAFVDRGETPPSQMVREFYHAGWWAPLQCGQIADQAVASTIFNFAVNTSGYGHPSVAAKLLQIVVGATPDGSIGPKTLELLNAFDAQLFIARFALAKVARYTAICNRDRSQVGNLLGWINRSLEGV